MLHFVNENESLNDLSLMYNVPQASIEAANILSRSGDLPYKMPVVIPDINRRLPRCGATPYYIVQPGDTVKDLAEKFETKPEILLKSNNLKSASPLFFNTELLLSRGIPDADSLYKIWSSSIPNDNTHPPINYINYAYYSGSFLWESIGDAAVPYLLKLLKHPSRVVRFYTIISLGRIVPKGKAEKQLEKMTKDIIPILREYAAYSLKRIKLSYNKMQRIHVMTCSNAVYKECNLDSQFSLINKGSSIIVLKWFIPTYQSIKGIEDIKIFDFVQCEVTGITGFMPRISRHGDTSFI